MRTSRTFEYPEELLVKFNKAKRLEWITLFYFFSTTILMAMVAGNSQAMKTAWIEDVLSLIPPACFLISSRIFTRRPDKDFPYGYHRVAGIAFLISSVTLTVVGSFLLIDSLITLLKVEKPSINTIFIGHQPVWMGYIMIIVLIYSTVPSMILGILKKPISEELLEKNLYTDAQMNKADWMTGIAGIVGVIGIGIGWWWADAVAAIVISFDILHDGLKHLKQAVLDLMNQTPRLIQNIKKDPVFAKIKKEIEKEPWVKEAGIRFRQEGHIYFGEAFIVPSSTDSLTEKMEELKRKIEGMHWKIFDVSVNGFTACTIDKKQTAFDITRHKTRDRQKTIEMMN